MTFPDAILAGVTRCTSHAMLSAYWRRWAEKIEACGESDRIVAAFRKRRAELLAEEQKWRDKDKWRPAYPKKK